MKKSAFPAALLLLAVASSGCPVYDSRDGCYDDWDCYDGYVCDGYTGACVAETSTPEPANTCSRPRDCGANETCSRSGTCMEGDCSFKSVGCVRGYECSSDSGRWECVASGSGEGGSDAGGSPNAGAPSNSAGSPDANAGAPAAGGAGG